MYFYLANAEVKWKSDYWQEWMTLDEADEGTVMKNDGLKIGIDQGKLSDAVEKAQESIKKILDGIDKDKAASIGHMHKAEEQYFKAQPYKPYKHSPPTNVAQNPEMSYWSGTATSAPYVVTGEWQTVGGWQSGPQNVYISDYGIDYPKKGEHVLVNPVIVVNDLPGAGAAQLHISLAMDEEYLCAYEGCTKRLAEYLSEEISRRVMKALSDYNKTKMEEEGA